MKRKRKRKKKKIRGDGKLEVGSEANIPRRLEARG